MKLEWNSKFSHTEIIFLSCWILGQLFNANRPEIGRAATCVAKEFAVKKQHFIYTARHVQEPNKNQTRTLCKLSQKFSLFCCKVFEIRLLLTKQGRENGAIFWNEREGGGVGENAKGIFPKVSWKIQCSGVLVPWRRRQTGELLSLSLIGVLFSETRFCSAMTRKKKMFHWWISFGFLVSLCRFWNLLIYWSLLLE